jgi:hypothetical protein
MLGKWVYVTIKQIWVAQYMTQLRAQMLHKAGVADVMTANFLFCC